jgi:hypothetical protein
VTLSGTVVLAYAVWLGRLAEGRWALPVWVHVLEYAPVLLLTLWWGIRTCGPHSSFRLATKPTHSAAS